MSLNIQEKDPVTGELKRKVVAGNSSDNTNKVILTKAEYDAIEVKDPSTVYYVTDDIEQEFADQKVMKVISLTREEYDALEVKDPDIYYDVEDEEYGMFIDDECYDSELLENKIWSASKNNRKGITIYVDYENGSDDNDGLTKETPIQHMGNYFINRKYGNCYSIVVYLLSDYDVEGTPITFSQQSINFYGGESSTDIHRIYSSLPMTSSMMSFSASSKVNLRYFIMEASVGYSASYFISFSSGNGYVESCKFVIGEVTKKPTAFIEATRSLVYSTGCIFDCGENNTTTSIFSGGCGMVYFVKPTTIRPVRYLSQCTGSILSVWLNGGTLEYTTLIRYPARGNLILIEGVIQKDFINLPIPECPSTTPGSYILKAVVGDDNKVNYQWVNEVSGVSLLSDTPVAYNEEENE